MNAPKREYGFYLKGIKLSMERIEGYLENMTYLTFKENHLVIDAVIRNLEIIGEAAKNIPAKIKKASPHIPWNQMYGLRNLIAHEYFGIDLEMIWEIAKNNLPQNRIDVMKLIEKKTQY